MAREFEIKLEIPESAVGKVMHLPWLWELASGELQVSCLSATYYDTPTYALRERGITLRVHRSGPSCPQRIKPAANGAAPPVKSAEWKEEIAGEAPELKRAVGMALDHIPRKKLKRKLQPCFEAMVDRSAFPIQSANSAIEVAIDRATISQADRSASFCEIELELKRGASSELARIARRIAHEVPAALALKTKAERGFDLLKCEPPRTHPAEPITLEPSARVGEAFQQIGWSCLRHFALNGDAVRERNPQGVHQMRVALRRLRAAISLFGRMLDGPETDAIKAELKWLTDELASARELDVFLEETLRPLYDAGGNQAVLSVLCEDVAAQRAIALQRAKAAVMSDRYRQMVLRAGLWLIAKEWSDRCKLGVAQPSRRVRPLAHRALATRTKRAIRKLRRLSDLDAQQRHELRIRLKTIRYAAEFFDGVLPDCGLGDSEFLYTLKALLDDLGRLNDIAIQERLRDDFMASWDAVDATDDLHTAHKAFALGYVLGQQQQEKASLIAATELGRHRLARVSPFPS